MTDTSARKHVNWRAHLTADEAAVIRDSDLLAVIIEQMRQNYEKRYGRTRQLIVNRAIQRAKNAARTKAEGHAHVAL